jgi:alpha-tubulin suppressor-like RCC1 family protein
MRSVTYAARRGLATAVAAPAAAAAATAAPAASAAAAPGSLFIWGKIDDSRMGMKVDVANANTFTQVAMGPEIGPTAHPHLSGVVQAVCKGAKTLALTKDGAVYSWGTCDNNSLGHGAGVRVVHRPKRIEALEGIKIVQVRPPQRCGAGAACAGCG